MLFSGWTAKQAKHLSEVVTPQPNNEKKKRILLTTPFA